MALPRRRLPAFAITSIYTSLHSFFLFGCIFRLLLLLMVLPLFLLSLLSLLSLLFLLFIVVIEVFRMKSSGWWSGCAHEPNVQDRTTWNSCTLAWRFISIKSRASNWRLERIWESWHWCTKIGKCHAIRFNIFITTNFCCYYSYPYYYCY